VVVSLSVMFVVVVGMVMMVPVPVIVIMLMATMTADLHVAAVAAASTFLTHKFNSGLTTQYTKHTKPSPKERSYARNISRSVPL
jgi:hypothetical protein